jgi:acetyl esterase/lipase
VVAPAPVPILLLAGALAPEISPLLVAWGAAVAALSRVRAFGRRTCSALLVCGAATAALALPPLVQLPAAERAFDGAMRAGLGARYRDRVPAAARRAMRPAPFRARDVISPLLSGEGAAGVRVVRDLAFAAPGGVRLLLDVYEPPQPGARPTLVVIPGGGWRSSDRRQGEPLQRYMAARGYLVVAVSYRHAPDARFPAQLQDVRSALAFVRANAGALRVDTARVALVGASAGAHLALLAAYEPGAPPVRAVVNYYGPSDLAAGYRDPPEPDPYDVRRVLADLLGGSPDQLPERYDAASPVRHARADVPPTLHVYGGRDHIVKPRFGRELHERLRAAGATSVYLELPWSEHGFNALLSGLGGQLSLYYSERFLAWAMAAPERAPAAARHLPIRGAQRAAAHLSSNTRRSPPPGPRAPARRPRSLLDDAHLRTTLAEVTGFPDRGAATARRRPLPLRLRMRAPARAHRAPDGQGAHADRAADPGPGGAALRRGAGRDLRGLQAVRRARAPHRRRRAVVAQGERDLAGEPRVPPAQPPLGAGGAPRVRPDPGEVRRDADGLRARGLGAARAAAGAQRVQEGAAAGGVARPRRAAPGSARRVARAVYVAARRETSDAGSCLARRTTTSSDPRP